MRATHWKLGSLRRVRETHRKLHSVNGAHFIRSIVYVGRNHEVRATAPTTRSVSDCSAMVCDRFFRAIRPALSVTLADAGHPPTRRNYTFRGQTLPIRVLRENRSFAMVAYITWKNHYLANDLLLDAGYKQIIERLVAGPSQGEDKNKINCRLSLRESSVIFATFAERKATFIVLQCLTVIRCRSLACASGWCGATCNCGPIETPLGRRYFFSSPCFESCSSRGACRQRGTRFSARSWP